MNYNNYNNTTFSLLLYSQKYIPIISYNQTNKFIIIFKMVLKYFHYFVDTHTIIKIIFLAI